MPELRDHSGELLPVGRLLSTEPDQVEDSYRMQAAWFATISYQAALREIAVAKAERYLKECEAALHQQVVSRFSKKPSETTIKSAVLTAEPVRLAFYDLQEKRAEQAAWQAVLYALSQKASMLTMQGASVRLEKKAALEARDL